MALRPNRRLTKRLGLFVCQIRTNFGGASGNLGCFRQAMRDENLR